MTEGGQMWFEMALGFILALVNHVWEAGIHRRAQRREGTAALTYQIKWSAVRIFGLMTFVGSVILLANITLIPFILTFLISYITSVFYLAIRYGTT